jgi:uncharacterized MAPEG superfamily protein
MMQQSAWSANHSLLLVYTITCIILCLNLMTLWIGSGATRAKGGVAINPEDGKRYNVPVSEIDPPKVARILRAHRNAEAAIFPFLSLALLYILLGGKSAVAIPIFAIFVAARIAHSIFYLRANQPGRTISFAVSLLAIVTLLAMVLVAGFWPSPILIQ